MVLEDAQRVAEVVLVAHLLQHRALSTGKTAPCLLRGKREHGAQQQRGVSSHEVERRLNTTPSLVICRRAVESGFGSVEVSTHEGGPQRLHNTVHSAARVDVVVCVEGMQTCSHGRCRHGLVQRAKGGEIDGVCGGVEVVQVAEQEGERATQLGRLSTECLESCRGEVEGVGAVVSNSPMTQRIDTCDSDEVFERQGVAVLLGHLPPVAVHDEAMHGHTPHGGSARQRHRHEQRALEPSAKLVNTFEEKISGTRVVARGGPVHDAAVEPHVQDVMAPGETSCRAATRWGDVDGMEHGGQVKRLPVVHAVC
mmetsp:Transcript_17785/g.42322  ORF Transcript_17785/g.42322 Transcript_17785/m.42322 type:complete len:310 (+) Transcript_17785:460-1389(+)